MHKTKLSVWLFEYTFPFRFTRTRWGQSTQRTVKLFQQCPCVCKCNTVHCCEQWQTRTSCQILPVPQDFRFVSSSQRHPEIIYGSRSPADGRPKFNFSPNYSTSTSKDLRAAWLKLSRSNVHRGPGWSVSGARQGQSWGKITLNPTR